MNDFGSSASIYVVALSQASTTMTMVIYRASDNIIVYASFVPRMHADSIFGPLHVQCAPLTLWCDLAIILRYVLNIIIFITLISPICISSLPKR